MKPKIAGSQLLEGLRAVNLSSPSDPFCLNRVEIKFSVFFSIFLKLTLNSVIRGKERKKFGKKLFLKKLSGNDSI